MDSKLTIKLVAIIAFIIISFTNINAQVSIANPSDIEASAIPGTVVYYYVPAPGHEEVQYRWYITGGVFVNGDTSITIGNSNFARVHWSDNCSDYTNSNGANIIVAFGDLNSSPTGSYAHAFTSQINCVDPCEGVQAQINAITNNTSLTSSQQLSQIRAVINANPLCDLEICQ